MSARLSHGLGLALIAAGTVGFGASVAAKISAAPKSLVAPSGTKEIPEVAVDKEAQTTPQPFQPPIPYATGRAARSTTAIPTTPAATFLSRLDGPERDRALQCLTAAIYYEARNEPVEGQEAVAQVVLNRVGRPGYAGSVCGVVFQGSARRTGCQFTFTCDGSMYRAPRPVAWLRSREVAERVLSGQVSPLAGAATHYHTRWIRPYWSPSLVRIAQIGAHIFYRGRRFGEAAGPAAYAGHELEVEPANWIGKAPPPERRRVLASEPRQPGPGGPGGPKKAVVVVVLLPALEQATLSAGEPIVLRQGG